MEGGEWSGLNTVWGNEEADFMAQLFPNICIASSHCKSSYCRSKLGSNYTHFLCDRDHGSYYTPQDDDDDEGLTSGASNNEDSSLPFDFLNCHMDGGDGRSHESKVDESPVDPVVKDKSSVYSSYNAKKRPQVSSVERRKRNVKSKRINKLSLSGDEEENEVGVNEQSSSTSNTNDNTRASRGSATDPQSLYARKRRERISERLKILQSLVPNGTKVDISTMLEDALHYVKFLQLQIKMLISEDVWMYAPITYNGMNIGADFNDNLP